MNSDRWMTSREAAEYLGYKEYTLRRSRMTGVLAGRSAPPHATNKPVRYKKDDLDLWVNGKDGEG